MRGIDNIDAVRSINRKFTEAERTDFMDIQRQTIQGPKGTQLTAAWHVPFARTSVNETKLYLNGLELRVRRVLEMMEFPESMSID